MLLEMKPRFLHLAGWFAIILISLDLGIFRIPHTSPRLNTLDGILSGWDAQVIQRMSDLLSVWGCETFCKVSGLMYGKNGRIGVFVSPFFSACSSWLLTASAARFQFHVERPSSFFWRSNASQYASPILRSPAIPNSAPSPRESVSRSARRNSSRYDV